MKEIVSDSVQYVKDTYNEYMPSMPDVIPDEYKPSVPDVTPGEYIIYVPTDISLTYLNFKVIFDYTSILYETREHNAERKINFCQVKLCSIF